ncbi:MAG: prepilin-type N-terminal cleavage/methylation domain-containing protein [Lachnospiraceae bacterium]|nr:prepilin-type N-terminal cleavage/methylation domain-containing protein [Lachnospiraceae bacterium]
MNKKMNNKGFSLVELIIVIAIMAVLVGVLAPAYTRYIENARKSRDVSAVDSVLTVVETSLVDYNARGGSATEVTITVPHTASATNTISVECTVDSDLEAEIAAVMGTYAIAGDWEVTSGTNAADGTITATVNNGSVTFNNAATNTVVTAMETYSAALSGRIDNVVATP